MPKIVIINGETDNQLQEQLKIQGTICPEPYVVAVFFLVPFDLM